MYVDDATLFVTHDSQGDFRKELGNYAYVTQERNLGIQWGKALLITTKKKTGSPLFPIHAERYGKLRILRYSSAGTKS